MDLVDYSPSRFAELVSGFAGFADGIAEVTYIPISALRGDNVVERSPLLDWYSGPTLLGHPEEVEVVYDHPDDVPARCAPATKYSSCPADDAHGSPGSTPSTASSMRPSRRCRSRCDWRTSSTLRGAS